MEPANCLPHRKITRRGLLTRVGAVQPREHAGGGKRGRQIGHGAKAARAMHNFLLACRKPEFSIWLTFPSVLGPKIAKKHIDSFLGRLERALKHKFGVVVKMEIQARLAPEFCLLVWGATPEEITEEIAVTLWEKTIKAQGRIRIDTSFDWGKLSSYVSKKIVVRDRQVFIGNKPGVRVGDAGDTDDLSKEHKTNEFFPFLTPVVPSRILGQYREWVSYTGHYWWKRHRELIPQYQELEAWVPAGAVAAFRQEVNARRVNFFVGADDGFSIKGDKAVRAAAAISPALLYADERDSIKVNSPKGTDRHAPVALGDCTRPLYIPLSERNHNEHVLDNPVASVQAAHAHRHNPIGYHGIKANGGEKARQAP